MRDLALALLSTESAKRAQAEKDLARERGRADETAKQNDKLKDDLGKLNGKLAVSWSERDAVASEYESLKRWFWIIVGGAFSLYAGSIILPILANVFSGGAAGPALGIVSKVFGYIVSPAIQHAASQATTGLKRVGTALEDFRNEAPEMAAKVTQRFDAATDYAHQRVIGMAAKERALKLREARD